MKLIFMGTPEMAVPTLERIVADGHEVVAVITQPDKPAGRGNKLHAPPIKDTALRLNLPLHQPKKIKTDEFREFFSSLNADVAVVVAYGRILPKWLLEIPKYGCVNNHFSLLPKYRGAAPVNWAIANGETETGVTTMLIDEGLDTGDILLQRSVPISEDETSIALSARLASIGAELMSETLRNIESGNIHPKKQNEAEATHAPILNREDGLIDWDWPAIKIANRVRGFQPFPTAWTTWQASRLIIWQATPINDQANQNMPGTLSYGSKKDVLAVACGEGTTLLIRELQPEGKKRLSARDFLNGFRLQSGDHLG
ncbi:MAG TPA: methionyl-tRNA formyltransferase [Blastocatellia bacterium]|nr:methionyl-tRNA formyltransferase [Blastocatellia bacterium]